MFYGTNMYLHFSAIFVLLVKSLTKLETEFSEHNSSTESANENRSCLFDMTSFGPLKYFKYYQQTNSYFIAGMRLAPNLDGFKLGILQ